MLKKLFLLFITIHIFFNFSYSQGFEIAVPWKVKTILTLTPKFSVATHQIGISGEIGGNYQYSKVSGAIFLSLNFPYIFKNTLEIDPYFGFSALFPPITAYHIPEYYSENYSIEPDDDRVRRFIYGFGTYLRILAIRFSSSDEWSYLYFGARTIWIRGFGITEDALESLHSSNKTETYKIDLNLYLTIGAMRNNIFIKFETRLTQNTGEYRSSAYDPYGIGPSYSYEKGPFIEPEFILSIGLIGLLSFK